MTVQQLINQLMSIDDKQQLVHIEVEFGNGCFSRSYSPSLQFELGGDKVVTLFGVEDENDNS